MIMVLGYRSAHPEFGGVARTPARAVLAIAPSQIAPGSRLVALTRTPGASRITQFPLCEPIRREDPAYHGMVEGPFAVSGRNWKLAMTNFLVLVHS